MHQDTTLSSQICGELRVAYQGEPGAFSEEAALTLGRVLPVPCASFAELFSAIHQNRADRILAPVENTIAGPVTESCNLLAHSGLFVANEITLPIRLQLIGLPGARRETIRKVRSHPVALLQCRRYLSKHSEIEAEPASDTAGCVREILELQDPSVAAIASERAATLYGGVILDRDIHDSSNNATRFLLLSSEPVAGSDVYPLQRISDAQIDNWRKEIDAIDSQLVELINQRACAARAIGRIKEQLKLPIYEPRREESIMKKISEANPGPLPSADVQFIFENIIAVMRAFQRSETASIQQPRTESLNHST